MGWCNDIKVKNIIKKLNFHLNLMQKNFIEKIMYDIFINIKYNHIANKKGRKCNFFHLTKKIYANKRMCCDY